MYSFYASIHALPDAVVAVKKMRLGSLELETLDVPPVLMSESFEKDFEEVVETVSRWERMFIEPDGSFVWVSSHDEPAWQVDGNLYDRDERLLFVDLKGNCPAEEFDRLLGALGWPAMPLMFQLTREAVFIAEAEFRRWAQLENEPRPKVERLGS